MLHEHNMECLAIDFLGFLLIKLVLKGLVSIFFEPLVIEPHVLLLPLPHVNFHRLLSSSVLGLNGYFL